ncbi:MAG: PEP-CTERM sorting domain-containing protein [Verrucomicrobiales bacterium]
MLARCSILMGLIGFTFAPAASAALQVFSASAVNAAGITGTRDAFRTAVGGGVVSGANGSFGGVRREINWDGVPDTASAPNSLPANFFNVNSPRGVVFSTPGTGFALSMDNDTPADADPDLLNFSDVDPSYGSRFAPFSAQRLFTPVGSNIMDVNFFVPGTATPAFVSAFAGIFTDVNVAGATSLQFFDTSNQSLGIIDASVSSAQGFSFLGAAFDAGERIGRVRITSGNAALAVGTVDNTPVGGTDLVVMDDFLYSEPIPEPAVTSLAAFALLGLLRRRRP